MLAIFDLGGILAFVVLAFSLLGWLVSLIQGKAAGGNPPPAPRRPPRPRDQRLQREIDQFLEDVGGGPRRPPAQEEPVGIEIVTEEELREAIPQGQSRRPPARASRPRQTRPTRPPSRKEARPKAAPPKRPASSSSPQLTGRLPERPASITSPPPAITPLPHQIDTSVTAHLGTFSAAATERSLPSSGHPLIATLRTQQGVRQAVLLNEILKAPLGLRSK